MATASIQRRLRQLELCKRDETLTIEIEYVDEAPVNERVKSPVIVRGPAVPQMERARRLDVSG